MNNELIERYIYAVTRQLPKKNREDVSMELRALIDDMLEERCVGEPTEGQVREVLEELGSPRELYAKYDEDGDKCLIGQPYYSTYKLALKFTLGATAGGLAIACVLLQILEPKSIGAFLEMLVGNLLEGVLMAYAAVTLMFTLMEKKGMKLSEKFSLDDLAAPPKKKQEISQWDCLFEIGFIMVFLAVFLVVPQVFCAVVEGTGEVIPVFDIAQLHSRWYILVLFALAGIVREAVNLMEKQYTKKVMVTTVAANLCSAGISIWWLSDSSVINPALKANLTGIFVEESPIVYSIFENFNVFLLAVLCVALVLDTLDAVVRTLRK